MPPHWANSEPKSFCRARKISACFNNAAWRVRVSWKAPPSATASPCERVPFPKIVVRCQNLPPVIDKGSNSPGVTPAEGGAPDIPRNANQCVVVRGCTDIPRHALSFARGPNPVHPDILPAVFPDTIRHVVECCFLRLRARPAFGQVGPDLGIRHRHFPVVVGPPVGDIEGERRPVDVNIESIAMACRGGIDRLARGPRIGQQECPVYGQPLAEVMVIA